MFFLKGLAAGIVIAAPVGPVGVMCVRRTLGRGLAAGLTTGLGAALADTLYGVVVALAITVIADLLLDNIFWFRLAGGVVLLVLGMRMLRGVPVRARSRSTENLMGDFLSALSVTGTNPITVVVLGVVFTAIGVFAAAEEPDWAQALIAGVFLGSALWWWTLAVITGIFRAAVEADGMRWINRVAAAIIVLAGSLVLIAALAPKSGIARFFDLPFA